MKKRIVSLFATLAMLLTVCSGMGAVAAADAAPVDLSIGATNLGQNSDKDWWPDDFIKHVNEVLNVNISWTKYDDDTFALALASGDQCDVMMSNKPAAVLTANAAVAMDDYLEEYGQNILKYQLRNDLLRKFLSNGDGKLYFHTPNTGYEDSTGAQSAWNGYLVRWDLYEKLGCPEMKTYEDYANVLQQMVELYPTNENGDQTYAMGIWNDSGLWGWLMGTVANMGYTAVGDYNFAWNTHTNEMSNQLLADDDQSFFWTAMKFYNDLYNRGLLDPDSFSMTNDDRAEKYANNRYVGGVCSWYVGETETTNREADPNSTAGIIAIPAEGMSGWYGQNAIIGWDGKNLYVSSSCAEDKIPAAVSFIDYLDSDEGNRTSYSGVQGVYWDYDDQGVPALLDSTVALKSAGGDDWSKTGIGSYNNFIGSSAFGVAEDGYYYDLSIYNLSQGLSPMQKAFCEHYGVSYPGELRYKYEQEGKGYSQKVSLHTTIGALQGTVPDDISTITSRIQEMMIRNIQSFVTASSAEEFQTLRDQFVNDVKDAGLETAYEWYNTKWGELKTEIEAVMAAE